MLTFPKFKIWRVTILPESSIVLIDGLPLASNTQYLCPTRHKKTEEGTTAFDASFSTRIHTLLTSLPWRLHWSLHRASDSSIIAERFWVRKRPKRASVPMTLQALHTKPCMDDYDYENAVRFLRNFHLNSTPSLQELTRIDEDTSCCYNSHKRPTIPRTLAFTCLVSLVEKQWDDFQDCPKKSR